MLEVRCVWSEWLFTPPLPRQKMPKSSIADFGMWDESFFASAQSLLSENLGGSFP